MAQSEIRTSAAAASRLPLCFALSRMFTWLAYFVLRVHIWKKAARLRLSERLACLLLARGNRLSRFGLALRFLIIHIFFAGA